MLTVKYFAGPKYASGSGAKKKKKKNIGKKYQ